MSRAYISISSQQVPATSNAHLYGELARQLPFAVEPSQRSAWEFQLEHLRALAVELPNAHFFYELLIPRMGRRADLVILNAGIVFVIEYKIGNRQFDRSALDQAYGYGLDLKHFHETSHHRRIVPVLVATESNRAFEGTVQWDEDQLARPIAVGPRALAELVSSITKEFVEPHLEAEVWLAGRYRPTPTIIEAAQALYSSHSVEEISRSEAGAENLTRTADYVSKVIESSKVQGWKSICFITGVPGSGKTLAGLNLATARQRAHSEEHAVFLSGNGPLVVVLREALALDAVQRASERGQRTSKTDELRRTSAFIQNIHHFRDEALNTVEAPVERVAIFDEAQRAWDLTQTSKFMRQKRGKSDFSMSEPHFLLSVMDRHSDWCTIVCLVGGGQEINTGEAGIEEWLGAIDAHFRHWNVHLSDRLIQVDASTLPNATTSDSLHLATSIRSFRAEKLSDFVSELLDGSAERARQLLASLSDFPLAMTRDLNVARAWLKKRRRGYERAGLVASSNALRLKPYGVFIKAKVEPTKWFLSPSKDVRSSNALEDAASEFEVQGLELDWVCACWDANFVATSDGWQPRQFKGTSWQKISDESRLRYVTNAYRVLLTRARQGMIIFVPPGDSEDATRDPALYDAIAAKLTAAGIPQV